MSGLKLILSKPFGAFGPSMLIFPLVTEIPAAQAHAPGLRGHAGAAVHHVSHERVLIQTSSPSLTEPLARWPLHPLRRPHPFN